MESISSVSESSLRFRSQCRKGSVLSRISMLPSRTLSDDRILLSLSEEENCGAWLQTWNSKFGWGEVQNKLLREDCWRLEKQFWCLRRGDAGQTEAGSGYCCRFSSPLWFWVPQSDSSSLFSLFFPPSCSSSRTRRSGMCGRRQTHAYRWPIRLKSITWVQFSRVWLVKRLNTSVGL